MSDETSKMIAGLMEDNKRLKERVQFLEDLAEENRSEYEHLWKETERIKLKKFTPDELIAIKAEVELLQAQFKRDIYNQALAENERLRKAGDDLERDLYQQWIFDTHGELEAFESKPSVKAWLAAKGVQS